MDVRDETLMAERIGGLQEEIKELRKKNSKLEKENKELFSYEKKLKFYNAKKKFINSLCLILFIILLSFVVIYPIIMASINIEKVSYCSIVSQRNNCGTCYQVVGNINWNTDKNYGSFSSLEEARNFVDTIQCPLLDEE